LKRVLLENIGPFKELELELQPKWNVLLGDNGVGKSNILRAIALALAGEAAAPWAARMLRYNAGRGRVVLETADGDQRSVELTRPSRTSKEVTVKVQATHSLEAQPGLAIGFPPLRQLGWQPATGPEPKTATAYTTPEDLLPMLRGEPDPRMQSFKQFVVDLDFPIRSRCSRQRPQPADLQRSPCCPADDGRRSQISLHWLRPRHFPGPRRDG
jgi:energy-coupling factor transporter ATP-binding protein EcfA2